MSFPASMQSWINRNPIKITEYTGSNLTNFQVLVELQGHTNNSTNYIDFTKIKANGDDIRFTESDGETLLNYWIESFNDTEKTARIWVKINSIAASTTTRIYIYYNNQSASAASNGTNTFIFFENFESGSAPGWTLGADFTVVNDGYSSSYSLRSGYTGNVIAFKNFVDVDYLTIFECNVRQNSGSGYGLDTNAEIYFISNTGSIAWIRFGYPVSGNWGVNNDTLTEYLDTGYQYSEDTWYNIKFEHTAVGKTNIYVKPEGGTEIEVYHQKTSGNGYCGRFVLYSGKIAGSPYTNFDNLRVRRYTTTEPTTRLMGMQSATATIIGKSLKIIGTSISTTISCGKTQHRSKTK